MTHWVGPEVNGECTDGQTLYTDPTTHPRSSRQLLMPPRVCHTDGLNIWHVNQTHYPITPGEQPNGLDLTPPHSREGDQPTATAPSNDAMMGIGRGPTLSPPTTNGEQQNRANALAPPGPHTPQREAPPGLQPTNEPATQTPPSPPPRDNRDPLRPTRQKKKQRSRANVLIATLNVKGRTSTQPNASNPISKWTDIHRTMREKNIAVLCLQETHLEPTHLDTIHELFDKRITVHNSADPQNPSGAAGVAFVINKEKIKHDNIDTMEIIPGRAMLLNIKWNENQKLRILNVYAPTTQHTQPNLWKTITTHLINHNITNIDVLLGDFNVTEDPIDRAPARPDNASAIDALKTFRESYALQDTWRLENPTTRAFTYTSNTHSMSQLDRIYINRSITRNTYDWDITDTPIPSDHRMVMMRIVPPNLPYIGKGRWTLPLFLTTNERLLEQVEALGRKFQLNMSDYNDEDPTNVQKKWLALKREITDLAKWEAKKQTARITNKIKALKKDITTLEQQPDLDDSQEKRTNLALVQHELQHLELKQGKTARLKAQAKWHDKGEKINKYWFKTHTPRRPRDIMYALRDPTTNTLTTKTTNMADIAKTHHENLQQRDLLPPDDPQRNAAETEVLAQIPETQKFNAPDSDLHNTLTYSHVTEALQASKNGTATGLDGLPYELWKALHTCHMMKAKRDQPSFDIIACLTKIYNNIQLHGADPTTNFSIGWMCPLYKKKDRTRIENYRPITLLNTDYKIMTKALATQLAKHACVLLHPDQTGFVPTRSIFDPIRLAETMCAYAT